MRSVPRRSGLCGACVSLLTESWVLVLPEMCRMKSLSNFPAPKTSLAFKQRPFCPACGAGGTNDKGSLREGGRAGVQQLGGSMGQPGPWELPPASCGSLRMGLICGFSKRNALIMSNSTPPSQASGAHRDSVYSPGLFGALMWTKLLLSLIYNTNGLELDL